jgi:hypothetical protein
MKRIKADKNPITTILIMNSQFVKNTPTATHDRGIDGGKLFKGKKSPML